MVPKRFEPSLMDQSMSKQFAWDARNEKFQKVAKSNQSNVGVLQTLFTAPKDHSKSKQFAYDTKNEKFKKFTKLTETCNEGL